MPTDYKTRTSIRRTKSIIYNITQNDQSDSNDDNDFNKAKENENSYMEDQNSKISISELKTPTRRCVRNKRKTVLDDSDDDNSGETSSESNKSQGTPPKQRKEQQEKNVVENLFSPSRLIGNLNIKDHNGNNSDDDRDNNGRFEKIKSQPKNKYQSAKISLACTETNKLPGRENEIKQLYDFLLEHLSSLKSGSLYVSGQPGTGKTACLSNILQDKYLVDKFTKLYINCTTVTTIGSIYKKICTEMNLKTNGKTEKDYLKAIERFITGNHKMVLMVLDEIDQLVGKKQSVLYTIFELPSKPNAKIIIVGIANSLDLTDRMLTRLNANCDLKPKLLHFAPYTKQQIIDIFKSRLEDAGVADIFPAVTIQLLAAKVAAISGDVRRALDVGRRVIEIAEQQKSNNGRNNVINKCIEVIDIDGIHPIDDNKERNMNNTINANCVQPIQVKQVIDVLNNVYGASQNLHNDIEDGFPLQQKILICTLMLMLKKGKNKDITIGRLHEVYKRICQKRNILAVDQAEFVGVCALVETRGIIRILSKKEPRLSKVFLQWDDEEVITALKDKQLIATILDDISCLGK